MSYQPKRLTLDELGTAKAQINNILDGGNPDTHCAKCMQTLPVVQGYRCYYCHQWFCEKCMGEHLGDTDEG